MPFDFILLYYLLFGYMFILHVCYFNKIPSYKIKTVMIVNIFCIIQISL